jgi:lysophospholipase L1-like esterase
MPATHFLLIGDSVTDCGRARPVGQGSPAALGDGYVALVDAALRSRQPANPPRVTNMGTGGDTTRDLLKRWDADVNALRPYWLSVMIGINDVWRHFDPARSAEAVGPDEFRRNLNELVMRTRPAPRRLFLMTPFYVEPDRADPMRARVDAFGAIVAGLARRHDAILVDTQAAFDRALAQHPFVDLAPDRVHPTPLGHRVLADALLASVRL